MSQTLKQRLVKVLVEWPPKESIRENLPEIFLKSGYGKFCVIKDCAQGSYKIKIMKFQVLLLKIIFFSRYFTVKSI